MKTKELRTFINGTFIENNINAYYFMAPNDTPFPYLCWELRESRNEDLRSWFIFEINGFNKGDNILSIDEIFDKLENIFHGQKLSNEHFLLIFYKSGQRLDIRDPEPDIKHKRIQFEMQYVEGC